MKKYYFIFLDYFWNLPLLIVCAPFCFLVFISKIVISRSTYLFGLPYRGHGLRIEKTSKLVIKLVDFLNWLLAYRG